VTTTVLRGGRVLCPASGHDGVADLVLQGGLVEGIERPGGPVPEGAELIDVDGCWVLPGGVDLCAYVRAPGREEEETLEATLAGALRGGFTTVLAMPGTEPPTDGADDVRERLAAARAAGGAELLVAGCLTQGRAGRELAEIGEMTRAGAVAFTDAPDPVADAELLRRAMEYARGFERPVLAVGADPSLSGRGVAAEGAVATRLGLSGIPEVAEVVFVARHLELARLTGARVHLGALSSARSVELLRRARHEGLPVSAEVHPFHLLLDERAHTARPYDTALHLRPPLRRAEDREALLTALHEGLLLLASGHAPVGPEGKEVEFGASESGAVSLPTTLPLVVGLLAPLALAHAASAGPAALLGLSDRGRLTEGARADVVVLDPARPLAVDVALDAGARNTPFLGQICPSSVRLTLVAGDVRFRA
jgi:dihydroorotase